MKQKESFVSFFVKFGVLSLAMFLIFVWVGCGGEKGEISGTKIPETTKVISKEEASGILEVREDGTILLSKTSPVVDKFKQGNVVVSEPIAKAPYGFLRKVKSIQEKGAVIEVQTTQAALDEAIEEGEIKLEVTLSPEQVASYSSLVEGLSIKSSALTGEVGVEFPFEFDNVVLYDEDGNLKTKDDQIVANGEVKLFCGFVFEAKINGFEVKYFKFGPKVNESAELNISAEMPILDADYKKEVAYYVFDPIILWVGFVPVVFLPELSVYVGVDGNISFEINAGITQELDIEAGLKYENSEWQTYKNLTTDFNYALPDITAGGEIKGYIGPELKLKLYGVAGLYAFINGYLELEADLTKDPWWILYGGVEGKAGAKIEVLSYIIANFETDDFIGYKKVLAQAEPKPCTPNCTNKECGDDGCEGSCGICSEGENCQNGKCVEGLCVPDCSGKECGDDGCKGSCGNCSPGYNCVSGNCIEGPCKPNCTGKECGDDGCGNNCGSCESGCACKNNGKCVWQGVGQFINNCDSTITDTKTGLMWLKVGGYPTGWPVTLDGAQQFCGNLVFADYNDWRLPNISELRSIILGCPETMPDGDCNVSNSCTDKSCLNSACDGCKAGEGQGVSGCYLDVLFEGAHIETWHWSSTLASWSKAGAFGVGFGSASVSGQGGGWQMGNIVGGVNCVRGECISSCLGKECGDNGCGGSCGECSFNEICQNGKCGCVPNCNGKECGDDGCGESCGECDDPACTCKNGKCVGDTSGSFIDNCDGTVLDSKTGFLWQKNDGYKVLNGYFKWNTAKEYCGFVSTGDYWDWYLPTIDELRTLIIGCEKNTIGGNCPGYNGCDPYEIDCSWYGCVGNGCDWGSGPGPEGCYMDGIFSNPCSGYWSSTPWPNSSSAFVISFQDGGIWGTSIDELANVRCVRYY